MKKVEIYKLDNQGKQTLIAECRLINELVECVGEEKFIEFLNSEGVRDYTKTPPEQLFPKDGLKFLEQLKYNFKSGYLSATEKENGD